MQKRILSLLLLVALSAGAVYAQAQTVDAIFLKTTLSYVGAFCESEDATGLEVTYLSVNDDGAQVNKKGKIKNCGRNLAALRGGIVASLLTAAGMSLAEMKECNVYCLPGRVGSPTDADQRVIESAFQKVFGAPLVKERLKSADGSTTFVRYNTQALTAAFQKIYRKPNQSIGGFAMSTVYNTLFKDDVAEELKQYKAILKNKPWLARKSSEMTQKFKTSAEFSGQELYYKAAEELKVDDPHPVGFLIRREADGSLPAILGALKMILQDYDPATLSAYASIL